MPTASDRQRSGVVAELLVALAILVVPAPAGGQEPEPSGDTLVEVILFHSETCPHCAAERAFLQELVEDHEHVTVVLYEVSGNAANRRLFSDTAETLGFEARVVPTTIIGDLYWEGFNDTVERQILAVVEGRLAGIDVDPVDEQVIDVPGWGDVDLTDRSMLLSTVLIAFVDGLNPCSLWVLSLLLALVLHSGSRRRVVAVGAVFLAITTALYGLFIVGMYSVLTHLAYVTWIQRAVAAVAAAFAIVNIKDYFHPGKGPSLSISAERKPAIYRQMRALGRPEEPIGVVLTGTAALAVGVSLVETPCTAGFPILWTDLLAANETSLPTAVLLFAVYMAVFLVDELAVFGAAVFTMRAVKLQERHGRGLKLVAGTVMLALAVAMVVDPDRLSSFGGTLLVFGSATLAAMLIAAIHRRISLTRPVGDEDTSRSRPTARSDEEHQPA